MKGKIPALAKRSLALALALALLLSLCPMLPLTVKAEMETDGWTIHNFGSYLTTAQFYSEGGSFEYVGDAPYDWQVLFGHKNSVQLRLRAEATVTDANGNIIGTGSRELSCIKGVDQNMMDPSLILDENGNPALTTDLFGVFTITVDILYVQGGGKTTPVATMVKQFSRVAESAEPEETTKATTEATTEAPEETTVATEPETPDEPEITDPNTAYIKAALVDGAEGVVQHNAVAGAVNFSSGSFASIVYETINGEVYFKTSKWQSIGMQLPAAFLEGFDGNATVTFEYLEMGSCNADFLYDAVGNNKMAHATKLAADGSDSGELKTVTYELTDAVFANLYGKGIAFALKVNSPAADSVIYIKSVTVTKTAPETPDEPDTPDTPDVPGSTVTTAYVRTDMNEVDSDNMTLSFYNWREGQVGPQNIGISTFSNFYFWDVGSGLSLNYTLSDAFLEGFDGNVIINVSYITAGPANVSLVYHSTSGTATVHPDSITVSAEQPYAIKTATFTLNDAVLTNAYELGCSFALLVNRDRFRVTSVEVSKPSNEPGITYNVDLSSDVADLVFYDETPFDLSLDATTDGNIEVVDVTYTLSGGNLGPALTETKKVTLKKEGVNILDAAWFTEKAIGFGDFVLEVTMANEEKELVNKTFHFSRKMTSILSSDLTSAKAENKNGVLVFEEDAAMDLELFLKNKLSVPFSGTLTYTVSYNGTALENYNELTVSIDELFGDASKIELSLPEAAEFGIYELAISVKDAEDNEVHAKAFTFARQKTLFVDASLSSATYADLVFVDDAPFDMSLNLRKLDGYAEKLNVVWGIFSGEEMLANGKFPKDVLTTETPVKPDWSSAVGYGTFTLKLQITNSLGYVQELELPFSRIESVKVDLTSESNTDLVFTDNEAYDLKLSLLKQSGEDRTCTINYTVANGETVVKTASIENVSISATANVLDLDMTGVDGNGNFTITVTLVEGEEAVKTAQFTVVRKPSMTVSLAYPSAMDVGGKVTYIDFVPYDFSVSMQKPQGDAEEMTVNYTVTDTEGNEVATGTTTASVGSAEAAVAALDLSAVMGYGSYGLAVVVLDANGNEVGKTTLAFDRRDSITSEVTSATNPDLIFVEGETFDLKLALWDALNGKDLSVTVTISGGKIETPLTKTVAIKAGSASTMVAALIPQLSSLNDVGTYTLNMTVTDKHQRPREDVSYTFIRVAKEGSVNSEIKSETSPSLVFAPGGNIDMMLFIEKADGIKEGFTAALTVTDKDGNEQMKVEAPIKPFVNAKFKVADLVDLTKLTNPGVYNMNLTLTDDSGNVRHQASTPFTIVSLEGSVELLVGSTTNPDLIYTEGEDFDLGLIMKKTDGIAEAFKATLTVTDKDGNKLKDKVVSVPAQVEIKTAINNLIDLSDLPATGSFKLNIVMIDAAGNERANLDTIFHRVKLASVKTQISCNTNSDMIFTDKDAVDLMLFVQKTDGIAEELYIQYAVFDPDGNELTADEGKTVVPAGESYFKLPIELAPEQTAPHGRYNALLTIYDNNGNIRSETETGFIRISGSPSDIKHQVSGSSTGTKMLFTPGMTLDLCLFMQKLDGVPETLPGELYVTAPSGKVVYSIKGNLNIPAGSRYFKFPLPLNGVCDEFGIYTVTYSMKDDAGNQRVSGSAKFKIVSPTGEMAVSVQSASGEFPGLIYGKDDAFDLVLFLQKADGVEQTLKLRYTIYDMNGLVLETKEGNINVPALGYRKVPVELPDIDAFDKYGIFTIKVEVAGPTGEMMYSEEFDFSRVLTPEKQLDVIGVCTHLAKRGMSGKQSQQYVDLARQAGASFWRDELPWSTVEPAKGTYYIPAVCDSAVDYTLSIGLEPLFVLDYGNTNYGTDVTTDEWLEGYLGYVEHVVTHFKGRIKYYEVWNEWNIGIGGLDKKYRDFPELYARLLIPTYKLIKEIDPSITVIGGVVAGGEEEWTEGLLKCEGAAQAMDAFSFHCYPDNDVKEIQEQAEKVRALLTKYGRPDIPLWLTETGWPTHIGRNSFTEEVSAGNLVSMYTWAVANPGILDQIFWYDLHNDGVESENIEHNFGLLHNWNVDSNPVPMGAKRSYVAMNAVCAILADAEFVGLYDLGHKKITAYHFKKDGKDMLVTWADDVTLNMIANVGDNNIIVTDMYGNASALTPVDGKVSLFFSDAPIYIEYDLTNKLELVEGGFKLDKQQYSATPAATFPVQITRNNGLEAYSGSYAFSMPEGWSVENIEFGAAEAGATEITDTVYVTVSDDATKGESTLSVRVISDGNIMGQFTVPIEMGEICTVNPDVVFTDDGAEFKLSVQIINENSNKPLTGTINLLAPETLLGEASSIPFEIPAGENKAVLIDVPAEMANTYHTVKVEVVLGGGAKHEVTKPVSFLYAIKAPENMKLDGVIDDQWDGAMAFTIGEDDWFNDVSSDAEWPGNTATGYAMWDDEYLYVAVSAYDESHYQEASGASIWMYDSVQMATDIARSTVPGYYGFNEVGYSLSTDGSTIENWNWFAAPGKNVSEGGIFTITRDEATKTTTYEVAVPWVELLPAGVEFDFRNIGFSLLVNDNSIVDGEPTGRTGWIEYMSGVGYRKDVTLFGDLILAERPEK